MATEEAFPDVLPIPPSLYHNFTLLAMFLALFFLLFTHQVHAILKVTLQENNKNTL